MRNGTRQLAAWVVLCALAPAAQAVDIVMLLPLKEVLELPEAKGRLDGSVRFHLAGQPALQVLQMRGEEIANKKAVLQDKSPRISCERAAVASLLILQQGARREGANAVVDIVSFYKQNTVANAATIECHVGTFSAFVTLKGSYASVAP